MEKNLNYLFIPLFCLTACQQPVKLTKFKGNTPIISVKNNEQKISDTTEYLDWDSAKINGIAHIVSTKQLVYRVLGKPDSIVTPNMNDVCGTFFNDPFKYVYIKGSEFELHGDSIVVSILSFKNPALKLVADRLVLDNSTTLTSLGKLFPYAIAHKYEVTLEGGTKVMAVMLNTANKVTDDKWLLFFNNDKLIRIDHYVVC